MSYFQELFLIKTQGFFNRFGGFYQYMIQLTAINVVDEGKETRFRLRQGFQLREKQYVEDDENEIGGYRRRKKMVEQSE